MNDAALQKISEVISITDDEFNKSQLIDAYNILAAQSIAACQIVDSETGKQCGERASKSACFKTVNYQIAWTLYVHVCDSHLEFLASIPERLHISPNRFVIGDRARCEQTPYSADSGGDNQRASG